MSIEEREDPNAVSGWTLIFVLLAIAALSSLISRHAAPDCRPSPACVCRDREARCWDDPRP
jgi:hypothetical protein